MSDSGRGAINRWRRTSQTRFCDRRRDRSPCTRSHFRSMAIADSARISFLTILPVGPAKPQSADVAASFGWFPLVGFGIGSTLCAVDLLLAPWFGNALRRSCLY